MLCSELERGRSFRFLLQCKGRSSKVIFQRTRSEDGKACWLWKSSFFARWTPLLKSRESRCSGSVLRGWLAPFLGVPRMEFGPRKFLVIPRNRVYKARWLDGRIQVSWKMEPMLESAGAEHSIAAVLRSHGGSNAAESELRNVDRTGGQNMLVDEVQLRQS